jgi:hypothetical protein
LARSKAAGRCSGFACAAASPQTRKIRQVRKIVHLADLLKLVAGKIDAKLGLQPRLLEDSVVSNIGGELRSGLTVELHVADRAVDEPRRQAIAQPLERRAVHPLANALCELAGRVGVLSHGTGLWSDPLFKMDQPSSVICHAWGRTSMGFIDCFLNTGFSRF